MPEPATAPGGRSGPSCTAALPSCSSLASLTEQEIGLAPELGAAAAAAAVLDFFFLSWKFGCDSDVLIVVEHHLEALEDDQKNLALLPLAEDQFPLNDSLCRHQVPAASSPSVCILQPVDVASDSSGSLQPPSSPKTKCNHNKLLIGNGKWTRFQLQTASHTAATPAGMSGGNFRRRESRW